MNDVRSGSRINSDGPEQMGKRISTKWNVQFKFASDDERVLKVGDLVWLIDESIRRHENRMARVTEVFPGTNSAIPSASIETANGVLRSPQ